MMEISKSGSAGRAVENLSDDECSGRKVKSICLQVIEQRARVVYAAKSGHNDHVVRVQETTILF